MTQPLNIKWRQGLADSLAFRMARWRGARISALFFSAFFLFSFVQQARADTYSYDSTTWFPTKDQAIQAFISFNNSNPSQGCSGYVLTVFGLLQSQGAPLTLEWYWAQLGATCNGKFVNNVANTPYFKHYFCQTGFLNLSANGTPTANACIPRYYLSISSSALPAIADLGLSKPMCCNGLDPINPLTGGEVLSENDFSLGGMGRIKFDRIYNSLDLSSRDLGKGWRHTYSRSLFFEYASPNYPPPGFLVSSPYLDGASACTSGFAEIRANTPSLQNASASYSSGSCTITSGSTQIPVQINSYKKNDLPLSTAVVAVRATRDDGRVLRFTSNSGIFSAEPGVEARLVAVAGGFRLIDEADNIETYDSNGRLQSVADRAGNTQSLGYNANLLTSITDNTGHSLTLGYDTSSRLHTVTGPNSLSVTYDYDSAGHLWKITNSDGSFHQFLYQDSNWPNGISSYVDDNGDTHFNLSYDTAGRVLQSQLNGVGTAMSFVYNSNGSTTQTDVLGAVRTFSGQKVGSHMRSSAVTGAQCLSCGYRLATTYGAAGYPASETDYNNKVTTYIYDGTRGLEVSRTEASGTAQARTITTAWHATFRLPVEINEPGRKTTFSYDSSGNLLTRTIQDTATNSSRTWTFTYDSFGHVLTANGPRTDVNDTTTYTYNNCTTGGGCGQLNTVTDALGHVTTFNTYDGSGRPLTLTDPNGLNITLVYNTRGWLTSKQAGTELTQYGYDNVGQLTKVTLPNGAFLSYSYDAAHRLTQIQDQIGNKVVYTLDAMGNRTAEKVYNAVGTQVQIHTRVFNNLNQLWKDIGSVNQTTVYSYDNNGNLTGINDPLNHSTVNTYDALNRLTQVQDPANNTAQYGYNALDQLVNVTDPRSLSTSYATDALGNVSQVLSPDTGATNYTYDAAGNVKTQQDAKGQATQYQYDALNRLTMITRADSSTVSYTYDSGTNGIGHLGSITDSSGSTSWTYDIHGRTTQKVQSVGGNSLTTQYAYDGTGQLISTTLPSGKVIGYTWTNGQVSALMLNGNPLVSGISYQPFGGPISWIFANGQTVTRSYDQDGRVSATPISTLSYDTASRINGITLGNHSVLAGSKVYDYDALDRLTSFSDSLSTINYSYDANGNRATQTNTGGAANGSAPPPTDPITPINVLTYDTAGRLSTGNGAAYLYNGLGQRVSKAASSTTLFGYDEAGQISGEYDNSGNLIQETIRIGDMPVAILKSDGTYYVHADHLNTPRQIDNSSGQAVWAWDTFTFGGTLPNQDPLNTGAAFTYNLRHPGQYFDSETGLFQNGFRDYSSYTGRYVESDPIGLNGGSWSTYGYVDGNPISLIDPDGLETPSITLLTGSPDLAPLNNCQKEAYADFAINLFALPSYAQLGLDMLGIDLNFFGEDPVEVTPFNYGANTGFAAAGHAFDQLAAKNKQRADRLNRGATEAGIRPDLRRGRTNRARAATVRATTLNHVGGLMGPIGAATQLVLDLRSCGCSN